MWVEHIANGDVRRPCHAGVRAPGIKKLGIDVVPTVAKVVDDLIRWSVVEVFGNRIERSTLTGGML